MIRLARLAATQGGKVAAVDVEQDDLLAQDPGPTSAAARMLASGIVVVSTPQTEPGRWFPSTHLTFTQMRTATPTASERG